MHSLLPAVSYPQVGPGTALVSRQHKRRVQSTDDEQELRAVGKSQAPSSFKRFRSQEPNRSSSSSDVSPAPSNIDLGRHNHKPSSQASKTSEWGGLSSSSASDIDPGDPFDGGLGVHHSENETLSGPARAGVHIDGHLLS